MLKTPQRNDCENGDSYDLKAVAALERQLAAGKTPVFFVKHFSPFSSFHIPIVIMGNSSLSAGLVRIQIPQLRPAA